MQKYIFILGKSPELSIAEIETVVADIRIIKQTKEYILVESEKLDCDKLIDRLGGTIKIGIYLGKELDIGPVLGSAMSQTSGKRFNFGFSFYNQKPSNFGMKVKKVLKEKNISSRLVVSREKTLSSVIVKKRKVL